jgi:hypothetical protein
MKTSFLITVYVLTFTLFARGNEACGWTSSKSGVTVRYIAACDFRNQIFIDSILTKVVTLLNRQDTTLQILVLVNYGELSFPNSKFSGFISIAYDTLRLIDDDYIFGYYWNQESISTTQNGGRNTFESRRVPIDINSTNIKSTNNIGIKIFYDRDYRLGETVWSDLIRAIVYAAKNAELIKVSQKRDTVRYNTNGWYVSLVTLDTFAINKIIGKDVETKQTKQIASTSSTTYLIIALIGFFTIGALIIVRKHSR